MKMTNGLTAKDALAEGLAAVRRNPGLVALLLVINIAMAAMLAAPLTMALESSFRNRGSGETMMYGFDFPWWDHFKDKEARGAETSFTPAIFGRGFAFKNLNHLLHGDLPAGLLHFGGEQDGDDDDDDALDGSILALGVAYMVLQVFLAGGIYASLRRPRSHWTMRSLFHGSGFYFGRFARIALIALALDWVLFALNAPLGRFADSMAREAVSERSALAWSFGRYALLLAFILLVHMVAGYARAITVLEERSSAVLAWASAWSFCLSRLVRVVSHYGTILLCGGLLLAVWSVIDNRWEVTGYKTQLVALALAQLLVFARIALRVGLASGQLALYRGRGEA
jgi:hypothetical protein